MGTVRYTTVNGEVLAEKRGGVRRQYLPDPLGSTVALLDNTQAKTDTFQYWPYGDEAARTGTTPTLLRFVGTIGYYRDSANRLYVRARHLDTRAGRWMTEDPIGFMGGDGNILRYVRSSPTTNIDPSGTQSAPFLPFGWCSAEDVNPAGTWPFYPFIHPCNDLRVVANQWAYGYYCGLCRSGGIKKPGLPKRKDGKKVPYDELDAACEIHDNCLTGPWEFITQQFNCNYALCRAATRCAKGLCSDCDAKCRSAARHIMAVYCPNRALPVGGHYPGPIGYQRSTPRGQSNKTLSR
jgi:RHS repeat-associated protein